MDANSTLSQKPPLFGLPIFVDAGVCIAFVLAVGFILIVFFYLRSRLGQEDEGNQSGSRQPQEKKISSEVTKEIETIKPDDEKNNGVVAGQREIGGNGRDLEAGKVKANMSSGGRSSVVSSSGEVEKVNIGWGRWYSLVELDAATGGFAIGNVIGEGGYGIVYRGVLPDCSVVAVKKLLNNKGQADKEFKVEVEAIGKVRHKSLVGLIGYCVEDTQRMLVYEYVDNGNLEQWLHGDVGPVSPLTWDIRMRIAIGTAKGIAYLHEGLEPKVVHRDIKSSNILLDQQWNAKVSDFGLAKLLESDSNFVTTRVMGTFGYVAPDYASTGKLNEASDVYSFGVLLMEIISGRNPIDYRRPAGEVNLVEWFKMVVGNRRAEEVVDPLIEVQPVARTLKRMLLICLRCIDPDVRNRPKMGQVVHMLEGDDFPFRTPRAAPINTSGADAIVSTKASSLLTTGKLESCARERSMWR